MDFSAAIDWVSAFPLLDGVRKLIWALGVALPWIGTGMFALVVWNPNNIGTTMVAGIREFFRGTKTVATELDTKVNARLDAQDKKLDEILNAIKPKVTE